MKLIGSVFSLVFLGAGVTAYAQQTDSETKDLRRALDAAMTRISALEAKQDKGQSSGGEKSQSMSWTDMIKLYGDLRYRHEYIDTETADGRHRHRIRLRAGLKATVNEEVDLGLRFATDESGDPVSTNQTLTGGFTKKDSFIDLAFADYHPESAKGVHAIFGKMNNPFYAAGGSQIIWDKDVTPEGVAFTLMSDMQGFELFCAGAGFWSVERSAAADTFVWGAQVGMKFHMDQNWFVMGASFFDWANIKGTAPAYAASGKGNTLTGGVYMKEYDVLDLFAEAGMDMNGTPVGAFANYVKNVGTASADHAWMIGLFLGKLKDPGSWAARWNYRVVEADASLADFAESDAYGGGTNARGHEFGWEYQIAKRWSAALTYYWTQATLGVYTDYHRAQVDLNFKF